MSLKTSFSGHEKFDCKMSWLPLAYKNIEAIHNDFEMAITITGLGSNVISCSDCNFKKSDYLAPSACITKIEKRNERYGFNEYGKDVQEYYDNCNKAGFLMIELECSQ